MLVVTFITLSVLQSKKSSSFPIHSELSKFKSDLVQTIENSQIYSKDLSKKENYIAYSKYSYLGQGEYTATFSFRGTEKESTECILEIVSEKGKTGPQCRD